MFTSPDRPLLKALPAGPPAGRPPHRHTSTRQCLPGPRRRCTGADCGDLVQIIHIFCGSELTASRSEAGRAAAARARRAIGVPLPPAGRGSPACTPWNQAWPAAGGSAGRRRDTGICAARTPGARPRRPPDALPERPRRGGRRPGRQPAVPQRFEASLRDGSDEEGLPPRKVSVTRHSRQVSSTAAARVGPCGGGDSMPAAGRRPPGSV